MGRVLHRQGDLPGLHRCRQDRINQWTWWRAEASASPRWFDSRNGLGYGLVEVSSGRTETSAHLRWLHPRNRLRCGLVEVSGGRRSDADHFSDQHPARFAGIAASRLKAFAAINLSDALLGLSGVSLVPIEATLS